jgi:uncharacterized membrane protein (DUF485 family)
MEPFPNCMQHPNRPIHDPPELTDWDVVAANSEFRDLMAKKARFVVIATLFFVAYYFALPILVGYAPEFMSTPVWGPVNIAYLFALSQFFMAWFIAFLYVRAASRFDQMGKNVLQHLAEHKAAKAAELDRA